MNITFTDITGSEIYVIPVVPDGTKFEYGSENETFDTLKGKIVIPGNKKLKLLSWESIFPVNKNYKFCTLNSYPNGWEYVEFIENTLGKPIRVVATDNNKKSIENLLMVVDDWSKYVDAAGNIRYSIKLTEFKNRIWQIIVSEKISR